MRDTSLTSEDLAIMSAKENLASLAERPGYAEAMASRSVTTSPVMVKAGLVIAAIFGLLIVPAALYIDTTWLRWIVIVAFALVAVFALLAAIGSTERFSTSKRWPAAVLAKRGTGKVTLLAADGLQHELAADPPIFASLKPGDVGVAEVGGSAPRYSLAGFHRL